VRNIYISICLLLLTGCATYPDMDFCESWSTDDGSGESVFWKPNPQQMEIITKKIGGDRQFICAEKNLSGHVSVVNFDGDYYSTNFVYKDGILKYVDEEIFVGFH